MPTVNFDLSDIKPLISSLGLGQAPPTPPNMSQLPPPPMQPAPTPAAAGFSEWAGDPQNRSKVADGIVQPGTPLFPAPAASPSPAPGGLGANIPIDPSASRFSIMPPQRAPMAFLNPPVPSSAANASPSLSPYQGSLSMPPAPSASGGIFASPGANQATTPTQRAFPNPVTFASGLNDKLAASKAMARPGAPTPGPVLVPPTSNPNPWNSPPVGPYNPPSSTPQLPQAASSQQPLNPPAGVQPLPGYAAVQPPTAAPLASGITPPPTGTPTAPAISGPSQLLPYQNKLQTDQAELQRQQTTGSGVSQIKNPWLRTIARIGDVAGSVLAPGAAMAIPGTTLHHDITMSQQERRIQGDRADIQDVTQGQQAAANLAHTTAETADIATKSQQAAARYGLKSVTDDKGNTALVPDTDSPYYKMQQDKDAKLQQQTELIGAQVDSTNAQKALRDAEAEVKRQSVNPNSPAYKLAVSKANTARINAGAAVQRAQAYMGNYLKGAYNVGNDGKTLPGAPIIADDNGNQTVVGATNAPTAIKNNANASQFNDVHGALDNVEKTATDLIQSGGRLNSAGVAAALAQPTGTLGQWLQGAGVKANLTPQERAYVQSIAAAHENVQALRKSAGGTATDSAVAKLDAMIPGVSTPDLNYLKGQTGQIRATAERLGKGATVASGGLTVRGQQKGITPPPGRFSVTAPDGSVHPFTTQAAADRFKKLAGIK